MKKLLIKIMAIVILTGALNINVNAQSNNDTISQRINYQTMATQYLKKSHDQKVMGIVLGWSGILIGSIGLGLALSTLSGHDHGSTPDILMIGGGALVVAIIPISLASQANKKKATFYMQKENVMLTPGIKNTELVSVGIRIRL